MINRIGQKATITIAISDEEIEMVTFERALWHELGKRAEIEMDPLQGDRQAEPFAFQILGMDKERITEPYPGYYVTIEAIAVTPNKGSE